MSSTVKPIVEDQWLFCIPKKMQSHQIKIITLPHPGTISDSKFIFDESNNKLFEIKKHRDKYSSWLIDETVKSDGGLYTVTPFDPLFVLLHFLQANDSSKFIILDQLFLNDSQNCGQYLKKCLNDGQIKQLADSSGSGEFIGYKFSEDKTLSWLKQKVENTYHAIKKQRIFINEGNVKREDDLDEGTLCYACGIIADYIQPALNIKLHDFLNVPVKTEKRKSSVGAEEPKAKKSKNECNEDYSSLMPKAEKPKQKLTKKQRELSKVDTKGMKSISSFFSPKQNKKVKQ